MKIWKHFCTITYHKKLVMRYCFKVGLYKQGLLHDMSKYGLTEFLVGCKYYRGNISPNNVERMEKGYTLAWLHHKGRNKHHLEYWIDYGVGKEKGMVGMKMPVKYVVEMFIDRMCASMVYQKENYTDASPWNYYDRGKDYCILHPDVRILLESLLQMLKEEGESKTFFYIKNTVLKIDFSY